MKVFEQLGNYELIGLIKGANKVYRYQNSKNKQEFVAIKIFNAQLSPEDQQQFLNEVRIIANLQTPNIVKILDSGVKDDVPFLIMSYLPKNNLRQQHPAGKPVPLSIVVTYVKQIA